MDDTAPRRPIISDAEARNLPYLQAVIKEGLRIFPPVAGLMAKQAPPEGDAWNGAFIPGGTRVGWSSWAMFRRRDIFGEDAGEFRPERWLVGEGEGEDEEKEEDGTTPAEKKLREMEATIELVFSYGRYQCLGRPVALMELNKVFVEVCLLRQIFFSAPLLLRHLNTSEGDGRPKFASLTLTGVFYQLLRRFELTICDPLNPWKTLNCGIHAQSEYWIRAQRRR